MSPAIVARVPNRRRCSSRSARACPSAARVCARTPSASLTALKRASRRRTSSSSRACPAASSRSTRASATMTCPNLVACSAARASSRCRSASYEMAARRSAIVVRSRSATARAPVAASCSSRATPNRPLEFGEVFVRLAIGQAPLSRLERHADRALERAQAPREGLHRHLGGSPSLPHLRQPLRRGIGVVPLEQAGQHLGLGVGVGGDQIGALLDRAVDLQRQEPREDRAPLLRLAAQEGVELVLREEDDLREAVEVETEDLLHPGVGLTDATGECPPLAIVSSKLEGDRRRAGPVQHPGDPIRRARAR